MFRLVRGLKTDSKEVEGGRCMRGSGRKLCFSETERGKVYILCCVILCEFFTVFLCLNLYCIAFFSLTVLFFCSVTL